jgi:hypothetical protein
VQGIQAGLAQAPEAHESGAGFSAEFRTSRVGRADWRRPVRQVVRVKQDQHTPGFSRGVRVMNRSHNSQAPHAAGAFQDIQRPNTSAFVEREFRKYLTCGVAEQGFLRLR